jgi:hypothetical protein
MSETEKTRKPMPACVIGHLKREFRVVLSETLGDTANHDHWIHRRGGSKSPNASWGC